MSGPGCFLVTGATGVVGSAFAERVLRETQDTLLLVVRASRQKSAHARLDDLFAFWQLGALEPSARRRVRVLTGDTEAPKLGLCAEDWQVATTTATAAVHAAALVKMTLPLHVAREAAVSSVKNMLAFATAARAHRFEKLELVSTVGIGGRRPKPLREAWLDEPREFHNTYEAAKAEAEGVAHRALDAGLPLTILRPSMVVGDSRSGKAIAPQIFTYLCRFLTGTAVYGLFPQLSGARLDVVPVDWVSALLLCSSRTPRWAGRVLHACSADAAVPLVELRERVQRVAAACGHPVSYRATLPLQAYQLAMTLTRVFGRERGRKTAQLLGILLSYLEDEQQFENRETVALASAAGVPFIAPDQYLDRVLHASFERVES